MPSISDKRQPSLKKEALNKDFWDFSMQLGEICTEVALESHNYTHLMPYIVTSKEKSDWAKKFYNPPANFETLWN